MPSQQNILLPWMIFDLSLMFLLRDLVKISHFKFSPWTVNFNRHIIRKYLNEYTNSIYKMYV